MAAGSWKRVLHPLINANRGSYMHAEVLPNAGLWHRTAWPLCDQFSTNTTLHKIMLSVGVRNRAWKPRNFLQEAAVFLEDPCKGVRKREYIFTRSFIAASGVCTSPLCGHPPIHSFSSCSISSSTNADVRLPRTGKCHKTQRLKQHAFTHGRGTFFRQLSNHSKSSYHEGEHLSMEKAHWLQKYLPGRLWPFAQLARLDKPVGTWLLLWPCCWSIALAAPPGSVPDLQMLALFGAGAFLLRGAGCTINDLLDRHIDSQVERTRGRPIAAGVITPLEALAFLGAQLSFGLIILLQLNGFSQVLGASSLLLVGTYPLMKRWTFWPQAYLGLTFNWGALLGWAAVTGGLNPNIVIPLYAAGVSWTLVYDTIYAHQDKIDDRKVGVKSTALRFGDSTPLWLTGFGVATVANLAYAGSAAGLGWPFSAALVAASSHLAWQVATVDINNRTDCHLKFTSNKWFGAVVFLGIVLGKLVSSDRKPQGTNTLMLTVDNVGG